MHPLGASLIQVSITLGHRVAPSIRCRPRSPFGEAPSVEAFRGPAAAGPRIDVVTSAGVASR
jgi:hypothetical protein